jgi:hypothetical protein
MTGTSRPRLFLKVTKYYYDSKYQKHLGNFHMHWLAPFIVAKIQESGAIQLEQLDGVLHPGWVNGAHLNPYISTH